MVVCVLFLYPMSYMSLFSCHIYVCLFIQQGKIREKKKKICDCPLLCSDPFVVIALHIASKVDELINNSLPKCYYSFRFIRAKLLKLHPPPSPPNLKEDFISLLTLGCQLQVFKSTACLKVNKHTFSFLGGQHMCYYFSINLVFWT